MTKPPDPVKVIKAVPTDGRNDLYHTVDGYDWVFEHTSYSKIDVCAPGFFNCYRGMMRAGAVVECRLGVIADGITQVWLQVIRAPKNENSGDVLVSVGPSRKFTPVRHSGVDEKASVAVEPAMEDEKGVAA